MINKYFNNFIGNWLISRKLGEDGIMYGNANFEIIDKNTLHYKEYGKAIWKNEKETKVFREYIYKYDKILDKISVFFFENNKANKLFHNLNFKDKKYKNAFGSHLCNLDTYYAEYYFIDDKNFNLIYRVIGPTKNYSLETVFKKYN